MTEPAPALPSERLSIVGSGAIACGLAATAARHGPVLLLARTTNSAERARAAVDGLCGRLSGEVNAANVEIVVELDALDASTYVVEAVIEDHDAKARVLSTLHERLAPDAIIATTTSSLSIAALAQESGRPRRFAGLHVFNPVTRMKLVEIVFASEADQDTRVRTRQLCGDLAKTAVEVPDIPGFVVNRLLFPYLFSAVRLLEETGMAPADIDVCMTLGTAHPLGPLALLDLVGLDVALAIGETIGETVPAAVRQRVTAGELGRKSGRGFHDY